MHYHCISPRDKVAPVTVGHAPCELSRILSGRVYSTEYKRSPIPEGRLEVQIEVTFASDDKVNHDPSKIKSLIAENYGRFDSSKDVEHIDSDDECEVSLA